MPFGGHQKDNHFADLLNGAPPHGGWMMALWSAYFDESGTGEESPNICVGGYLFTKEAASELNQLWLQWIKDEGLSFFHMTDCNARGGEFARFTESECDLLARKAIGFITRYASHGIALSLEKAAFDLLPSGHRLWSGSPYAAIAAQVGYAIRDWVPESDRVDYVFEAGAGDQGLAHAAMEVFWANPQGRALFRHMSHKFMYKTDAAPLQCADILAWQWHKHVPRLGTGKVNKRGDLKELMKVPTVFHHYGREELLAARRALGLSA